MRGRKTKSTKSAKQFRKENEVKLSPVVRALIKPALRPLKSLNTSSTVRGLYGAPPSIAKKAHKLKVEVRRSRSGIESEDEEKN